VTLPGSVGVAKHFEAKNLARRWEVPVCDWPLTQCWVSGLRRHHFRGPIEKPTPLTNEWPGESPHGIIALGLIQTRGFGTSHNGKPRHWGAQWYTGESRNSATQPFHSLHGPPNTNRRALAKPCTEVADEPLLSLELFLAATR